jgi:hypothetical protein
VRRLVLDRSNPLTERAAALGRNPDTITRSFLFGFGPAPEFPWQSVDVFRGAVGRYQEIGITEFMFPEPSAAEMPVFEHAVAEIIPAFKNPGVPTPSNG